MSGHVRQDGTSVAIVGGGGNVGSYLSSHLRSAGILVTGFDMDPNIAGMSITQLHSRFLDAEDLQKFDTVLFLGGCTGRRACAALDHQKRWQVNVEDVVDVVSKMNSRQHFIVASTSAISEGRMSASETDEVFVDKLDEYSLSMFQREKKLQEIAGAAGYAGPLISMLRFGTVVGVSPGQRTDLLVPSLFRHAYTRGILPVQQHDALRSFLALPDLARAIRLLSQRRRALTGGDRLKIWNLASFHAKIMKMATTIASITGAKLDLQTPLTAEERSNASFVGFSLNCASFEQTFNFTFLESLQSTLADFDKNIPDSILPKGAHQKKEAVESIPCPVCGSRDLQLVLDLGKQPFANAFDKEKSAALLSPRFPLQLVRCRRCQHYHLSHVASRSDLFEHYLYRSGTSVTLKQHFDWLAQKVYRESGGLKRGSILELACNDGTQLDSFRELGWKTYGVDPAVNIAALAQRKNHTVRVGFWPLDFPELPRGDDLTAITAQNVFAHVPKPVDFLKACAAVMGPKTKLYIQTSQCNMQQLGEFDTIYHEHISFFTGHSFYKAAVLAGLQVAKFETAPIHGTSCLVTLELGGSGKISTTLRERLELEKQDGVTSEFFAETYKAKAMAIRDWVFREISAFRAKGYMVGAYGAAAKGMTLLHFILGSNATASQGSFLDFVLDDAPLKQNTYCPGTSIPVRPTQSLPQLEDGRPIAILVLAWNFFDEIADKLRKSGTKQEVVALVPFPEPSVHRLGVRADEQQHLRSLFHHPTPIPNPMRNASRRNTAMVTHFRNEELLLPFFIIHHAPMFDQVIAIDYNSTDRSVDLFKDYAPSSWKIVPSETGEVFDSRKCDAQVMFWEKQVPEDWVVALTTTEFLVYPGLRLDLHEKQDRFPLPSIMHIPNLAMTGDDRRPLLYFQPLLRQRHVFLERLDAIGQYSRFMHWGTSSTHRYDIGRHVYIDDRQNKTTGVDYIDSGDAYIAKWYVTPWPEQIARKVEVGRTIPERDKQANLGYQHIRAFEQGAKEVIRIHDDLMRHAQVDLCDDKRTQDASIAKVRRTFFAEVGGGCFQSEAGQYLA